MEFGPAVKNGTSSFMRCEKKCKNNTSDVNRHVSHCLVLTELILHADENDLIRTSSLMQNAD